MSSKGTALHTGDAVLSAHVMNARMREVRGGYWLMKDRQASKIDAAIASVLAYEARADAIADGALDVKRKRVMSF
jgi:phage terminase large subunit-like protein